MRSVLASAGHGLARALVLGTLLLPPAAAAAAPGTSAPRLEVKLRVRVAECAALGGSTRAAVQPPAWVDAHVGAVQALFAPHGIAVTAERETFRPATCEILTRAERDALAPHVPVADRDGAVTVLVLPRVRDLDVPTYDLMGVHWRAHGRRWVFLTARAEPPVLAHELCHYFGLPHDPAGGNLMTPGPSSPLWKSPRPPRRFAPVLTPQQVERLRAGIQAAAPAHEPPPPRSPRGASR